ncbi:MAG: hypothetical protein ACHQQS_01750 [Thermoanaerobaculales bacterium]
MVRRALHGAEGFCSQLLVALLASGTGVVAARATVVLPDPAPDCVQWAAGDVEAALQAAHVPAADARIEVTLGKSTSWPAESFRLEVKDGAVLITGADEVGAMYGLFELAEQITNGPGTGSWVSVATGISTTEQHPFLEFRADNVFCHVKPLLIKDVPMWEAYLDLLARCRFNVLDMHGGYDLTDTSFPNLYPQLVHVPEYPEVGDSREQDENLRDFKEIVAYAKKRGIKVALMNYTATLSAVSKDKLADYTAHAVTALLKAVPDLHMLGFRIGESGQAESFYRDAYLAGVTASGRKDVCLYTRSWGASLSKIEEIARATASGLDVEIKYNGEHLGLPYQAIQGYGGDYSYRSYLQADAPYRIIWQVRANGTHRFWAWQHTDFIRRTVRSCGLGSARGFTLEPHIAYFTPYAAAYYQSAADKRVYHFIWEKHWAWYLAWGRLSYNPDLPEQTIVAAYVRHFGEAGRAIYTAMQASGPILPLAFAYRFPGPDQRDFSPETETGCPLPKTGAGAVGATVDPFAYGRHHPMDARSFVSIDDFVGEKARNVADGRIGPIRVANMLQDAARKTRDAVDHVGAPTGRAGEEWRLLRADLLAASYLGEFHANRIRGTLLTEWGANHQNQDDFDEGAGYLAASREAWKQLAAIADATYAPLLNALRGQVNFRWASQLPLLEEYDSMVIQAASTAALDTGFEELTRPTFRAPPRPRLESLLKASDLAEDHQIAVADLKQTLAAGAITITLNASAPDGIAKVLLWYKSLPSDAAWTSVNMTRGEDAYAASVRVPSTGLLYLIEAHDMGGSGVDFPDALGTVPYTVVGPGEIK